MLQPPLARVESHIAGEDGQETPAGERKGVSIDLVGAAIGHELGPLAVICTVVECIPVSVTQFNVAVGSTGVLGVFGKDSVFAVDHVGLGVYLAVRCAVVHALIVLYSRNNADRRCSGGNEAEGEGVHDFVEDFFVDLIINF